MVDISDQDKAAAQVWLQQAVAADAAGDAAAAEHGFLQALACDPDLSDAYFGLGVACFRASRYDQAASYLQAVVARGEADAVVHLLLGQSLYQLGRFRDSAAAFESARNDTPLAGETVRRYVRAHMFAAMIDGDVAGAIARYPAIAGSDADPITDVIREGFGLLSAYGHDKAALGLGEWLIAATPDDPVQRHLNDAVARRAIDSVPPAYVEAHFDAFAAGFDDKLVGVLRYDVPAQLAALVSGHRRSFEHMLDLGCGTGLAGPHLVAWGGDLSGVDLSTQMLARAEQRGVYDALVHAEALDHLRAHSAAFDLIFAADTLIYFGRLDAAMAVIAQAVMHGGIFAASIECAAQDFAILPSGRFAHADDYLLRLAEPYFELLEQCPVDIRLEANMPVKGTLFVWRRR